MSARRFLTGPRHRATALTAGIALLVTPAIAATAAGGPAADVATAPAAIFPSTPVPAGGGDDWPITECGTYSGKGCAPTSARVDLVRPTFSRPTEITNPLFPVSVTESVLQLGTVDGKPFRSETTLLPVTGTVEWEGKAIPVVLSQYLAYLDGRIEELAIDRYAQADDGAVWYLGEDVFDYRDGAVAVTEGTWLAGRDGPPAMIMPARPEVGAVFRAENIIGVVFEEMRVKAVGQTVQGPAGPIKGAITVDELKLDGSHSEKVFAPGYGEFRTSDGEDVEALALAVPTDALRRPLPVALRSLTTSAWGVLENARLEDWEGASATIRRMDGYWRTLRAGSPPRLIADRLNVALAALTRAVRAEQITRTTQAAIDVAQASLDLTLRHLPVDRVEVERIHLHSQQLRVHADATDLGGTTSGVAIIEWIRDRLALPPTAGQEIDIRIRDLRSAADARNVLSTADHAARLAARLRELS